MYQMAKAVVGPTLEAAATFRVIVDPEKNRPIPVSRPEAMALIGLGKLVSWAMARKRSGLPAYAYVALTSDEMIVLEFRFGSTLQLKRLVGRWPLREIRVSKATSHRRHLCLTLPSSKAPVHLEGVFHGDAERVVIDRLTELATG